MISHSPLVSIIIPTFNRGHLISQAINSVQTCLYPRTELLVVDQKSTDGTIRLLDELKVRHIVDDFRGAGSARNLGLANTQGDLVFFLDSDDWLTPDGLGTLVNAIETSDCDLAFGQIENIQIGEDREARARVAAAPMFAPLPSASLVRRPVFSHFGQFDGDNFSFPRWVISARSQGLAEEKVRKTIAYRGIHDGNVGKKAGAKEELFSLVRAHRAGLPG